jgi:hypothetical protein
MQLNHQAVSVDGFGLVEYKIANAVENGFSVINFGGLYGVGVVAYYAVGTSVNGFVGLLYLLRVWFESVLQAPM